MNSICIFGASGKTGGRIAAIASAEGFAVTAFSRSLSAAQFPERTNIVTGDLDDRTAIEQAVQGADAVVCAFGPRPPHTDVFCAAATRTIIEAMRHHGVRRLVCITGAMVGAYPENRTILFNWMAAMFARQRPEVAADRVRQEKLIAESGLDWTIVKPPRLTDDRPQGQIRSGWDVRVGLRSSVTRDDLARFILDSVRSSLHRHEHVFLA